MTTPHPLEYIRNILQNFGYKGDLIDNSGVGSAASGLRFYIQSYGDSIQFRCGISLGGKDRNSWLEFANDYNADIRFAKVYLDGDDDLVIEADCWLDPDDANHVEHFRKCMDFWEISLAALKERLRNFAVAVSSTEAQAGQDTP